MLRVVCNYFFITRSHTDYRAARRYIRPRLNISVPLVSAARMLRCDLCKAVAHAFTSAPQPRRFCAGHAP